MRRLRLLRREISVVMNVEKILAARRGFVVRGLVLHDVRDAPAIGTPGKLLDVVFRMRKLTRSAAARRNHEDLLRAALPFPEVGNDGRRWIPTRRRN